MSHHSHSTERSTGDWLFGAVKKNPEGLLLLAAGCALLLRSGSRGGPDDVRSPSTRYAADGGRGGVSTHRPEEGISPALAGTVDTAREYAADIKDRVADTTSSYATAVSDYADEAKRTIVDQSERLAGHAQSALKSTYDEVMDTQPLAVAFVGLAAGAAIAAAFPTTQAEQRALGPTADRLSDAAKSTGKQLNKAAAAASDKLMSAADERGLNADGLKEVVSEVAETFESTFSGDQNNQSSQRRGTTGAGGPATEGQSSSRPSTSSRQGAPLVSESEAGRTGAKPNR
jgi:hypothetical protein